MRDAVAVLATTLGAAMGVVLAYRLELDATTPPCAVRPGEVMPICQGPVPSGVAVLLSAVVGVLVVGLALALYRSHNRE